MKTHAQYLRIDEAYDYLHKNLTDHFAKKINTNAANIYLVHALNQYFVLLQKWISQEFGFWQIIRLFICKSQNGGI